MRLKPTVPTKLRPVHTIINQSPLPDNDVNCERSPTNTLNIARFGEDERGRAALGLHA
jgi:hypothetical protein